MKEHELKTDCAPWLKVVAGHKKFEIRFNDRDYQVRDILKLRRTVYTGEEMAAGKPLKYAAHPFYVYVTYIMIGPVYGLKDGWVIMGITPMVTAIQEID